uniref:Uncharacterized protein n=1 Tax=Nelumbo nucifera TaxID=4432 RepID=A0A822YTE2_NELNU|nr:TPA_asm: hypothetical protein HUJ06_004696 [Nelumbo nucifera]
MTDLPYHPQLLRGCRPVPVQINYGYSLSSSSSSTSWIKLQSEELIKELWAQSPSLIDGKINHL